MDYILIIVGFTLLVVGANFLVDGAVGIAKRFHVPDLIIGLTIVALGTSAPELAVNLFASMDDATTDIALTNIIGSNTINTFIILGAAALVYPIKSQVDSRKFDIPMSLLAPVALLLLAWCFDDQLSRTDGIILLLVFAFFMSVTVLNTIKTRKALKQETLSGLHNGATDAADNTPDATVKPIRLWVAILMVVGGLVMLVVGGQVIVNSATKIAESLGISQAIIGLTIVALGTSLPELATSVVAAMKKNSDIALGNVIGSNIFNVFLVLGISATIRPLPAYSNMVADIIMTALGSLLVLVFVTTNKKHEIKRWEGLTLLCIYVTYLIWIINTL